MLSDCSKGESLGEIPTRMTASHFPVLLDEIIEIMEPKSGKKYIDATGGPGNMSAALLEKTAPDGIVLTMDCDPHALEEQHQLLDKYGSRSIRRRANFVKIAAIAEEAGIVPVDGILFDLGLSSRMVDHPQYGLSIMHDAPLDMRMDPDLDTTAFDLVNGLSEKKLIELLRGMDEIRWAGRIARAIVQARENGPINTTHQLAEIVTRAIPRKYHPRKIHPATKTFLALRVAVNHERESLTTALKACSALLKEGGVLAVICYSSFEDQIVREVIRENSSNWTRISKKAIRPKETEIALNPRARSARLRAYRKAA